VATRTDRQAGDWYIAADISIFTSMPWAPSRGLALWLRGSFPRALGCLGGHLAGGRAFFFSRLQRGRFGRPRAWRQFPMHTHGDKIHQQAVRYVLIMTGALAIDFRAARQTCCRGL
jgi:hypothetical protein